MEDLNERHLPSGLISTFESIIWINATSSAEDCAFISILLSVVVVPKAIHCARGIPSSIGPAALPDRLPCSVCQLRPCPSLEGTWYLSCPFAKFVCMVTAEYKGTHIGFLWHFDAKREKTVCSN